MPSFKSRPGPRVKKLPVVFSQPEVKRLLAATDNLKHRLLLQTVYSSGLRVSELVRLKPHHIESDPDRMMIRVDCGKGKRIVTRFFPTSECVNENETRTLIN